MDFTNTTNAPSSNPSPEFVVQFIRRPKYQVTNNNYILSENMQRMASGRKFVSTFIFSMAREGYFGTRNL